MVLDKMQVPFAGVWELSESESLDLASAMYEVARLHNIAPNPYVLAYGNLIGTCGVIYGVRYVTHRKLIEEMMQRQRQPQHAPAQTAPIEGVVIPDVAPVTEIKFA